MTRESREQKISRTMMRALCLVDHGEVYTQPDFRNSKMVMGLRGVPLNSFWTAVRHGLIRNGRRCGAMKVRCQQILTDAGRKALETGALV